MEGIASPMLTVASAITAAAAVACATELAFIIDNQRRTRLALTDSPVGQAYQLGYATGVEERRRRGGRRRSEQPRDGTARGRAQDRWDGVDGVD